MKKTVSFGIRRELKNKWERRVPLTPIHVENLVKDYKAKVYVQPSTKRIYPDASYERVIIPYNPLNMHRLEPFLQMTFQMQI